MSEWYADGSGWNGTQCGWAIIFPDGSTHVDMSSKEALTNNECEYKAVLCAAYSALSGDTIYTDSQLVVKQVSGEYKCKVQHLQRLLKETVQILSQKNLLLKWVPRKQNKAGKIFE